MLSTTENFAADTPESGGLEAEPPAPANNLEGAFRASGLASNPTLSWRLSSAVIWARSYCEQDRHFLTNLASHLLVLVSGLHMTYHS